MINSIVKINDVLMASMGVSFGQFYVVCGGEGGWVSARGT